MSLDGEDAVKKALGIGSFRELSKDGVMRLAAMMPDLPKEVALKIVEQFPEYRQLLTETLNVVVERHESTLKAAKWSQKQFHRGIEATREILKGELQKDIEPEERRFILEKILDLNKMEDAKDDKTKSFLLNALKILGMIVGGVVLSAVAFVGGKFVIDSGKDSA